MTDPAALLAQSLAAIDAADSPDAIEAQRIHWLGKKGALTEALKTLGSLPPEERKALGAELNRVKEDITSAIARKEAVLSAAALEARLAAEKIDVTLPPRPEAQGRIHPISQVIEEITAIFADFGFSVAEGPQIEDDYHNFTALNIPESHPARQMHDTFYLKGQSLTPPPAGGMGGKPSFPDTSAAPLNASASGGTLNRPVLRTHTSPVQIRVMKGGQANGNGPPFRCIAPGATFRSDSDQTHTPMFHQVEGFVIDKGIHMGHLKGCLEEFLRAFFEMPSVPVRFRPSFFPFTEPSAEVDIGCKRSKDSLVIGEGSDWLEVLGCGMVHPNVLKNCGLDPDEWQGFAFGMGVERLAMLKYGIPDLRTFFASDQRWLAHYGFAPLHIPTLAGGL